MKSLVRALSVACLVVLISGAPTLANSTQLASQIQGLLAPNHYWHRIAWKKSLIEGLAEARRTNRPVFVWAFIDMPDEERC